MFASEPKPTLGLTGFVAARSGAFSLGLEGDANLPVTAERNSVGFRTSEGSESRRHFIFNDGCRRLKPIPSEVTELLDVPPRDAPVEASNFNGIFRGEFDYVWNSLRRLGVPARDLEDLAHDVFFRVYEQLAEYDVTRPLKPWLFGFCFRVASDYRRRFSNRREVLNGETETQDTAPNALDRLVQAEILSLAQCALNGIEIERRAVFILHEIDGCTVPEIASALGLPLNTGYSRLRLAREEFHAALRRERLRRGER